MECEEKIEAELYESWISGNPRAGGELSKRCLPMLSRFVRRRVGDRATADDLVSSILLQLCKSRYSLKDPRQFRAFVMGIAWNTLKEHYRKQSHERLCFPGDQHLEHGDSTFEEPDNPGSNEDDRETLVRALRRLPIEDQQILMTCYAERMSYARLGAAFELEPSTVASRLHAAKERLSEIMREFESRDAMPNEADDFTNWAVEIRRGIDVPNLGAVLPRRVGRWRLIEFESTSADTVRSAYRRKPFQPVIELEIDLSTSHYAGTDHGSVAIGDRSWSMQFDRARDEHGVQATLCDGRMLRLRHWPATEWQQVKRFAGRLCLPEIEAHGVSRPTP
jgi:RNA polymerase sigma factor (sigma-70 family)